MMVKNSKRPTSINADNTHLPSTLIDAKLLPVNPNPKPLLLTHDTEANMESNIGMPDNDSNTDPMRKNITYNAIKAITLTIISLFTILPLMRTGVIVLGNNTRYNSFRKVLQISTMRSILMPPEVLPAHAPIAISTITITIEP